MKGGYEDGRKGVVGEAEVESTKAGRVLQNFSDDERIHRLEMEIDDAVVVAAEEFMELDSSARAVVIIVAQGNPERSRLFQVLFDLADPMATPYEGEAGANVIDACFEPATHQADGIWGVSRSGVIERMNRRVVGIDVDGVVVEVENDVQDVGWKATDETGPSTFFVDDTAGVDGPSIGLGDDVGVEFGFELEGRPLCGVSACG